MTSQRFVDTCRTAPPDTDRSRLARIARRLASMELSTGSLASLRRSDPASVLRQPAYHRLLLEVDDRALGEDGAIRWATAVQVLALLADPGSSRSERSMGAALADAGFPESRLARLLASRGDTFRDQAILAARFLRARDVRCVPLDLAELAIAEGRAERRAERLRFHVARSYYAVIDQGGWQH